LESGGGGWGDPLERPAEWVLDDVIDELVTVDRAADVYGVIISIPDGDLLSAVVDDVATVRARDLRLKS
jgi:N-methylhydantoinase B